MLESVLAAIQQSPPAEAMRSSAWLYPAVNTVHVLAAGLVFGMVAAGDLRLLGLTRTIPADAMLAHTLPWVWLGFAAAAVSGLLLFASDARALAANPLLLAKLGVLLLAGLNAALFHAVGRGRRWITTATAAASLAVWVAVLSLGRWISYY